MSTSPKPEEVKDEAVDSSPEAIQAHLDQGSKLLALRKYELACDELSTAVELLTDKHGELAPECGEALILLGTAMLRNAVSTNSLLGTAPADRAESKAAPAEASGSKNEGDAPSAATMRFHFGGDGDLSEGEDDEEEGEGEGEEDEKEDDYSNAFQTLEIARVIYERAEGADAQRKLVEIHKLQGDVMTEDEQFGEAIKSYEQALEILEKVAEPHDRSLAELYMLIALSFDLTQEPKQAVTYAERAKKVLLAKLEQLKSSDASDEDAKDKIARETKEIQEVMGDVDLKIEELRAVPQSAEKSEAEKRIDDMIAAYAERKQSDGPAAAVNNLNNLVKRKKRATEDDTGEADAKKAKVDS